MADTKISALTAVTAALGAQEFGVNDAATSKKVSLNQIVTYLQTKGMPRVFRLSADHTNATTTATEVTNLGPVTLEAGTYTFKYTLITRSDTTTTGIRFGLNFTGTAAVKTFIWRYPSTGTTAISGIADDFSAMTGVITEGGAMNVYSTTTPNMGNIGHAVINVDHPFIIEGIIVVTASGNLALWHSSEAATTTTVKIESSLVVIRTV